MTVHCRGEALDQVHSPGPWLLKMTLNVVRHLWRSRGRTSKREVLWMSECPPSAPPSPIDELEMRRAVQRLEKAVASLPENYRMIYFMCEVQHLPAPEIAALTGLTPDTLRVRRFRARQQVAKLLGVEAQETRAEGEMS